MIRDEASSVLLVEDEMLIALDLEEMISGMGYRVTATANSLERAMESVDLDRPDIALIDGNLADGPTGVRIAEKLSEAGILCIAVSANPELFAECDCIDQFLAKPVDERKLTAALRQAALHTHGKGPQDPPAS